ncbi:hypothetical protein JCM10207_006523 [Rhodosporidiobolus poonsookiae]
MAPSVLPQYSSLPSSASLLPADSPPPHLAHRTTPSTTNDASSADDKPSDSAEDTEYDERTDQDGEDGRQGLLSGQAKRDVDGEEDDDTLADALRVESRKREWLGRIPISPRTIFFSLLSVVVLLLLGFLFHPSSPYSRAFSSSTSSSGAGLYSSHGALSSNPLPNDSKYGDVPFAKVGATWSQSGKTPTWAGGDDGEKELEKGLTAEGGRRWNGTHWWDPTVLLISLDGFRADYLEKGMSPNLLDISRRGLRAEYLEPVFPSLTFPNHWSIMTGLYPSAHGIVANDFYDPSLDKEFVYTQPAKSWPGEWWGGEPIWATAVKNALRSAVLMWPGPPVLADGTKPTLWYPFVDKYHYRKKADRISKWLDMPYSHRPHLMAVYTPEPDQAGHRGGPESKSVAGTIRAMDEFVREVFEAVDQRNLSEIVDVVVVSDHGMADVGTDDLIFLDDILSPTEFASITHNEGWPSAGLRLAPGTDDQALLAKLRQAGKDKGAFECYDTRKAEAEGGSLERWHWEGNERISPIYCVPHLGWAFTTHAEYQKAQDNDIVLKGNHGYDPTSPEMHAIFVAHGPFANRVKSSPSAARFSRRADIPTDPATTVVPGFKNLEVYDLVADLLRIPVERRALNNGTSGFWEGILGPYSLEDGTGA